MGRHKNKSKMNGGGPAIMKNGAIIAKGKKGNRDKKNKILAWLKAHIESNNCTPTVISELKSNASAKNWRGFGNLLKNEWTSNGFQISDAFCLDNSAHCRHIWEVVQPQVDAKTEGGECVQPEVDGETEGGECVKPEVDSKTEGGECVKPEVDA